MKKILLFIAPLLSLFIFGTSECMHRKMAVKMHSNRDNRAKDDRRTARNPRNNKVFTVPRRSGNPSMKREALVDGPKTESVSEFAPMIATSNHRLRMRTPHSLATLSLVTALLLLTVAMPVEGALQGFNAITFPSSDEALNRQAANQQRLNDNRRQEVAQQSQYWAEQRAANERKRREDEERYWREKQAALEAERQRRAAEEQRQRNVQKQAEIAQASAERLHQAHLKEQADREAAARAYAAAHPQPNDPGFAPIPPSKGFVSPLRKIPENGFYIDPDQKPWDQQDFQRVKKYP